MTKKPASKAQAKQAVHRVLHMVGMYLLNLGIEIQVVVAQRMGVPHARQAVRQILIDQLLQRFREEAEELGVPEEEVRPLGDPPRDARGLH